MPSLLPSILSWGGLLLADWSSPGMACITPVLRLCRSCRGQATFSEATVGRVLSSSPGSSSPRWSRQSAAGAAGPLARAGPLYLALWRLLGCQPADSAALGIPLKSSPRNQPCKSRSRRNTPQPPTWRAKCRGISCRKNTWYHTMDPKIRMQGAVRVRSISQRNTATKASRHRRAQRTTERVTELYPGSGPSW
jgi:hypothetical protein